MISKTKQPPEMIPRLPAARTRVPLLIAQNAVRNGQLHANEILVRRKSVHAGERPRGAGWE